MRAQVKPDELYHKDPDTIEHAKTLCADIIHLGDRISRDNESFAHNLREHIARRGYVSEAQLQELENIYDTWVCRNYNEH